MERWRELGGRNREKMKDARGNIKELERRQVKGRGEKRRGGISKTLI